MGRRRGAGPGRDPVPRSLVGKALAETGIGARTGLSVVALSEGGHVSTDVTGETVLGGGVEIVMVGGGAQRDEFAAAFG